MLVNQNKNSDDRVQLNKAIEIVAELRLDNSTSVSHYSLGVPIIHYSFLVLAGYSASTPEIVLETLLLFDKRVTASIINLVDRFLCLPAISLGESS